MEQNMSNTSPQTSSGRKHINNALPWYKQPALLISFLALIVSLVSAYFSIANQNEAGLIRKKEELQKTITALIDLKAEKKALASYKSQDECDYARSLIEMKENHHIEAAEELVSQISAYVSSSQYYVLAQVRFYDSDFVTAEKYFKQAIKAAKTNTRKVLAMGELAIFYFYPYSPFKSFDKGRKLFSDAIALLGTSPDPYINYLTGRLYEDWSHLESQSGFTNEGIQKFGYAKRYFRELPADFPLRQPALDHLAKANQTPSDKSTTAPYASPSSRR